MIINTNKLSWVKVKNRYLIYDIEIDKYALLERLSSAIWFVLINDLSLDLLMIEYDLGREQIDLELGIFESMGLIGNEHNKKNAIKNYYVDKSVVLKSVLLGIGETIHVDLTYSCNFNCGFCYLGRKNAKIMTVLEFDRVLDEAKKYGFLGMNISGGEPTNVTYLQELLIAARKKGFVLNFLRSKFISEPPSIAAFGR